MHLQKIYYNIRHLLRLRQMFEERSFDYFNVRINVDKNFKTTEFYKMQPKN